MDYPLSGDEIIERTYPHSVNLMVYKDLNKYKSIEELFSLSDNVVVLYRYTANFGHWIALLKHGNTVEVFDSLGVLPDQELSWLKRNDNAVLGQQEPHLSKLLLDWIDRGGKVWYNEKALQSKNSNTCGRFVIYRINNSDKSPKEFQNMAQRLTEDKLIEITGGASKKKRKKTRSKKRALNRIIDKSHTQRVNVNIYKPTKTRKEPNTKSLRIPPPDYIALPLQQQQQPQRTMGTTSNPASSSANATTAPIAITIPIQQPNPIHQQPNPVHQQPAVMREQMPERRVERQAELEQARERQQQEFDAARAADGVRIEELERRMNEAFARVREEHGQQVNQVRDFQEARAAYEQALRAELIQRQEQSEHARGREIEALRQEQTRLLQNVPRIEQDVGQLVQRFQQEIANTNERIRQFEGQIPQAIEPYRVRIEEIIEQQRLMAQEFQRRAGELVMLRDHTLPELIQQAQHALIHGNRQQHEQIVQQMQQQFQQFMAVRDDALRILTQLQRAQPQGVAVHIAQQFALPQQVPPGVAGLLEAPPHQPVELLEAPAQAEELQVGEFLPRQLVGQDRADALRIAHQIRRQYRNADGSDLTMGDATRRAYERLRGNDELQGLIPK